MDAATIAHALEGRKCGHNNYRMPCPVCGGSDKATKFSATDAGDRLLVYCFAGCTFVEIVAELRDRGLWPESTHEQRQQYRQRSRIAAVDEAKTYVLLAESAIDLGEQLTARERQRLFLSRKIIEGVSHE